jgi:RIO kinase 1
MANELALLLEEGVIDEVIGGLKTGKEAEVYLVRHQGEIVAAKIYKERHARSFQHNADYKEGRLVRNTRTQRAMDRGSKFGQAAAEDAWKSAESDALYRLHGAGVRVPAPVLFYEGVLLMQLVVDAEGRPAPRLIDAQVPREAAAELYRDLRRQATTMLCEDLIHGDLSAYNVLLGAAGPTVIDFPQIISAAHNSRAEFFFTRDLEALRTHLAAIDPELATSRGDAAEIWRAFVRRDLSPDFVPSGKPPPDAVERPRHGGGRPQRDGRPHSGPHDGQRHRGPPGQRPGAASQPGQPHAPRQEASPPGGQAQQSRAGAPRHEGGRGSSHPPRQHDRRPGHEAGQQRQGGSGGQGQRPPGAQQGGRGEQGGRPSRQPHGRPGHQGQRPAGAPQGDRSRQGASHPPRPGQQANRRGGRGPEVSYVAKAGGPPPAAASSERREPDDKPHAAPPPPGHTPNRG